MGIVMPAIIVLETVIILWLLMMFARRRRMAFTSSSIKPPGLADYFERAMTRLHARRAQTSTSSAGAGPLDGGARAGSSGEGCV
ncbi:hypothetical protein, partial [Paraburkholderia hospita]|uniref:hypothetical protein n=1 Tax=Paraburkholderia hospita TaxID=169430 RepID=UPI001A9972E9